MTSAVRIGIVASMIAFVPLAARAEAADDRAVEIGGGIGALGSQLVGALSGGDVRITLPVSARGDVEALVAMQAPGRGDTLGFYGVQYKQRLRSTSSGPQPFLSYGGVGVFYVEEGHSMILPPFLGFVGGGVEQRVNRHLSVRVDAQAVVFFVFPVGVRVAAGVSVPIGRATR